MDKQKQIDKDINVRSKKIEEMAKVVQRDMCGDRPCEECNYHGFKTKILPRYCEVYLIAEKLYNAGYRKIPENAVVLPGFIDEHIHGIYGSDTMYGAEAVCNMSRRLAMHGVTGFLPTTMNAGVKETHDAVMGVKLAMQQQPEDGAVILGAHMEGPFLGEKYKGAQDARANLLPGADNFEKLTEGCGKVVRLITIAPELEGAEGFTKYALEKGIVVSAGHTDASYE